MIKKIKSITNLAVFKDFDWDKTVRDKRGNNIIEFKKLNIFYGRNYSGKTTLSRVFRALETKSISEEYEHSNFCLLMQDNTELHSDTLNIDTAVRVFNEDFYKSLWTCRQ